MNCPICRAKLNLEFIDINSNYLILKDNKSCHNCYKYFYQFDNGIEREIIGEHEFITSYTRDYRINIKQKIERKFAILLNRFLFCIKWY